MIPQPYKAEQNDKYKYWVVTGPQYSRSFGSNWQSESQAKSEADTLNEAVRQGWQLAKQAKQLVLTREDRLEACLRGIRTGLADKDGFFSGTVAMIDEALKS